MCIHLFFCNCFHYYSLYTLHNFMFFMLRNLKKKQKTERQEFSHNGKLFLLLSLIFIKNKIKYIKKTNEKLCSFYVITFFVHSFYLVFGLFFIPKHQILCNIFCCNPNFWGSSHFRHSKCYSLILCIHGRCMSHSIHFYHNKFFKNIFKVTFSESSSISFSMIFIYVFFFFF